MFAKFLQETSEQQHAAGSFFSQQLDFQDPGFGGFQGQALTRALKCFFGIFLSSTLQGHIVPCRSKRFCPVDVHLSLAKR